MEPEKKMALNKLSLNSWQSSKHDKCGGHLIKNRPFFEVLIAADRSTTYDDNMKVKRQDY